MQRLHEDDFVGHVLGLGGEWEVLNLPAIAEADEAYGYETFMGRFTYRRREGAALHASRIPIEELNLIRARMGEAAWASQYMQRPAPAGGGLVNTAWFKRYAEVDLPERFERVVQSWDTANTIAEWSDYSVCTTWGMSGKRIFLLDVFRKRLLYPDLKPAVVARAQLYGATSILIEDRASGTQLIQDLKRDGVPYIEARKPIGDKQMRMASQTSLIENGFVYVPDNAHWLAEYLHELSVFPNGKYDDQVDSTSQALHGLGNPQLKGWAMLQIARRENLASDLRQGKLEPVEKYLAPGSMEYAAEQAAIAAAKAATAEVDALALAAEAEQSQLKQTADLASAPPKPVPSGHTPGSMGWAREQAALNASGGVPAAA